VKPRERLFVDRTQEVAGSGPATSVRLVLSTTCC